MNRRKFIWGMYTLLLLAMCFVMVSCEFGSAFDENFQIEQYPEGSKKNPINLTVHKWTNKEIISVNSGGTGVQWFSFVAADTTQYIYAKLSTISGLDVYLYDSDFKYILFVYGNRPPSSVDKGNGRNQNTLLLDIRACSGVHHTGTSRSTGYCLYSATVPHCNAVQVAAEQGLCGCGVLIWKRITEFL